MRLYGISGLGADKRVFQYLTLDSELIPLDWISPLEGERIEDYAIRLSQKINSNEKYGILGVSFGGLVAVEISKILNPDLTILISSAETNNELRTIYRIVGKSRILKVFPKRFYDPPRKIANWIFGSKEKNLLNQILDDTDLKFAKWAVNELTNWRNTEKLTNEIVKIGGTKDKLIPPIKDKNMSLIAGGEHFMIVDRANEISRIVNEEIKKRSDNNGSRS